MRPFVPGSSVLILALLVSCGGGGGGDDPTPPAADVTPPTVPANVTATAQSSTQVLVSWSASTDAGTGVAGYRVFRDGSATVLATVTATNYTDNTAAAGTTYGYTVRAFDGATPANVSAASAPAIATTPPPSAGNGGLDSRPANASCVAGEAPAVSLAVQRASSKL